MESCDVLIIGGGPGGSTCAWRLRRAGLNVVVIDKKAFPRDKICAGWITPQVLESLELNVEEYSQGRVFQPITSFRTSLLGTRDVVLRFPKPVSYGIRRCEFDTYLLQRSGARLQLGEAVQSIERQGAHWVVNERYSAPMLVGAGGHFCPIARRLRDQVGHSPPLVTAVEAEFPVGDEMSSQVGTDGSEPRLYFCSDVPGYGWCVRKEGYLNIGIGFVNSRETSARLPGLLSVLQQEGAFTGEVPIRFHGHAYLLYDGCSTPVIDDGVLLVGDAAGLAYPCSGEGIRPAIESGILAARTILGAAGNYSRAQLATYERELQQRFGRRRNSEKSWLNWLPVSWRQTLTRRAIQNQWFARNILIRKWFLHADQPALLS